MRRGLCGLLVLLTVVAGAGEPRTVVETSGFTRTSLYGEVVELVHAVAARSDLVALASVARTAEGRDVPLVVLSRERVRTPAELAATGKPAVLVMANIHAGEVEGKEACQLLIREVGSGRLGHLLEHQTVLVIPIFNADGNDKLGHNRHDAGPELAGVRHNGQYLDLNRDYVKLESPEVRGLVRLLREWDPVLVVDLHTTNGSYHREPVTYSTGANPNAASELADHMWGTLFPQVTTALLERHGWDSVPYGDFVEDEHPEKGWESPSVEARYGSNYVALRNRLAILDESYSLADFPTRVLSTHDFVLEILEHSNAHAAELAALVREADARTRDRFHQGALAVAWRLGRLMDVTVQGFEQVLVPTTAAERAERPWLGEQKVQPTGVPRDYPLPYLASAVTTRAVPLPVGYVVLPGFGEAVDTLLAHGVSAERLERPCTVPVERFAIAEVATGTSLFQGHVMLTLSGRYERAEAELPAGSVYVDLRQPLARLAAVLLEPTSNDSLATWGFFSRALLRQWTGKPGVYPVLRVAARPPVPLQVLREP